MKCLEKESEKSMTTFERVAPRLALAHKQRKEEIRLADRARYKSESRRVELERLVAHRELQLVRAYSRNSARYVNERQRKLNEARGALSRLMRSRNLRRK